MGLNLQSDDFWELRPDNFGRMREAFEYREEKRMYPFRKLMYVVARSQGSDVEESDFYTLPIIDAKNQVANAKRNQPIVLTSEERTAKEERYKKVQEIIKANAAKKLKK
jgi:hypothetical protein